MVATTASVSPYAVSTVPKLSSARIRSTSATGTMAAPVTASRRLDRSRLARSGWSRIVWYSVGAPGSTVICSASISRIASPASNTGCGTMTAPVSKQARMPAL